ncbi:hypothetical protein M7I_6392 [Glarea lozoyensis 74030]|uniref:Uncharacterized protein n=1 Tax=Glarea lozoyensis (strain ATCC 74030 / MF5533) TaxID=1104152 RepID=H0EUG6_GLAL7|nr:hypothetical protein M7I_6392 [Glarea lozoyensis 74030]
MERKLVDIAGLVLFDRNGFSQKDIEDVLCNLIEDTMRGLFVFFKDTSGNIGQPNDNSNE